MAGIAPAVLSGTTRMSRTPVRDSTENRRKTANLPQSESHIEPMLGLGRTEQLMPLPAVLPG